MRLILNILWLVLGGLELAVAWILFGVVMFVTIVGIPWGRSCITLAKLAVWPFGNDAVRRDDLTGREDIGTGALGFVGNVIWFLLAGLWLAIAHALLALAFFITIIGIPFGVAHWRLARLALAPIGKDVVSIETRDALAARRSPPPIPR